MTHRFPIKEIARQAGLGTATVDRVLNRRPGVRRQTAMRVHAAIRELEAQEAQLSMSGRKLLIDLVVEAPQAFLDALQGAVARELPLIQTAIFRVRSDLRTRFPVNDILTAIDRVERLKSDGLILMAPDTGAIRQAIARLAGARVPVVTLATDMPASARSAYVGLDNHMAGETAAWLSRKWTPRGGIANVIVTKRNAAFRGEADREAGFRAGMAKHWPGAGITFLVQGEEGPAFAQRVAQSLHDRPAAALYSIGGGNRALVKAMEQHGLPRPVIVGHDLDAENRILLAEGKIDAVLYHDLAEDIRNACQTFMSVHSRGAIPMPMQGAVLRVMLPPMTRTAEGEAG